jgi:tetratricopeptide (TPR) repeat protein
VRGEREKAATELAALQKEFPNAAPVLNLVGAQHAVAKRFDLARAAYAKALEYSPGDVEALSGLVNIDLENKRTTEAIARVEAALKVESRNSALLILAARAYGIAGDAAKAESLLKQCIDFDPNRISAYSMLGELYARQNRLADARDQFAKVVEKTPRSVGANTMLGMLLEGMRDLESAEQQYVKTLAVDPNAAVAANNLAWLYASSNRNLDQALQLAQTAIRQLPDHPNVNDTLGWVYYLKALYPQAVRHLEASVKRAPADPVGHYHLGMAYEKSGEIDKAKASLRAALKTGNFDGADEARRTLAGLGG